MDHFEEFQRLLREHEGVGRIGIQRSGAKMPAHVAEALQIAKQIKLDALSTIERLKAIEPWYTDESRIHTRGLGASETERAEIDDRIVHKTRTWTSQLQTVRSTVAEEVARLRERCRRGEESPRRPQTIDFEALAAGEVDLFQGGGVVGGVEDVHGVEWQDEWSAPPEPLGPWHVALGALEGARVSVACVARCLADMRRKRARPALSLFDEEHEILSEESKHAIDACFLTQRNNSSRTHTSPARHSQPKPSSTPAKQSLSPPRSIAAPRSSMVMAEATRLTSAAREAETIAQSVAQVTSLVSTFAERLAEQQETVADVVRLAVEAREDISKGNEELEEAAKGGLTVRQVIIFLIGFLSLLLLISHLANK